MRLIDLFDQNILNALPKGAAEQKATGVTADSRQVSAGMIFVAIKGHTHDGHAFIQDAIKNGAVAVVSEEAVSTADALVIHVENSRLMLSRLAKAFTPGQPSIIAAVTGTNGKTSVADFLRQIWQQIGWRSASIGTLGVRGAHLDDVAGLSNLTTPDAIELHRSLNALSKAGVTNLAMEASSHGLEQNRLSSVFITAAGFTNLSRDHLDHRHGRDHGPSLHIWCSGCFSSLHHSGCSRQSKGSQSRGTRGGRIRGTHGHFARELWGSSTRQGS